LQYQRYVLFDVKKRTSMDFDWCIDVRV